MLQITLQITQRIMRTLALIAIGWLTTSAVHAQLPATTGLQMKVIEIAVPLGMGESLLKGKTPPARYTSAEIAQLLESVKQHRQAVVTESPRFDFDATRPSRIHVGYEYQYMTNTADKPNELKMGTAKEFIGIQLQVQCEPTPDAMKLRLDYNWTGVHPTVPLMPITTYVTPTFEGGSQGVPIPFTQFVQQPKFTRVTLSTTQQLQPGESAVMTAGKRTRYVEKTVKPAIAAWLPVEKLLDRKQIQTIEEDVIVVMSLESPTK